MNRTRQNRIVCRKCSKLFSFRLLFRKKMLTQGAFCKKDLHYSAGKMLILQSYEDTFSR